MNGGEKLANYQPTDFRFSPDDRYLTYLHAASHQIARQLWGVDLSPGSNLAPHQVASAPQGQGDTEATLSRDEKLRRERQRAYAVGMTAYAWAGPRRLLIPMQGSLFVQEGTPDASALATPADAPAQAPVPAAPLRLAYDAKASRRFGGLGGEEEDEDEELLFHDAAAEQQQGEGDEEDEDEWGEGDEEDGGLGGKGGEAEAAGGEAEAAGGAVDPHASPDGKWAAFVRRGELFVVPLTEQPRPRPPRGQVKAAAAAPAAGREQRRAAHGRPGLGPSVAAAAAAEDEEEQEGSSRLRVEGGALRLTFGADEAAGRTHGLAEFIAQEEMDRFSGFWWAPDSKGLAYCAVDEAAIPPYAITHQGLDTTGDESLEVHRYPFAGGKNARVSLWVLRFGGAEDGDGDGPSLEEHWAAGGGLPRPVPVRIDLHCSSMTPDPSSSSVSDDRDPRPSPMEMETAMMATADDERQQQQEERQQRRRRRRRRDSSGRDAATAGAGGGGEGGRGGSQRGEEEGDGEEEEVYVARVDWLPDGFLAVQVQDRRQSRVRLLRACPRTGRSHLLLEERALEGLWVNLHHLFRPLRRPILPPGVPPPSSSAAAAATSAAPAGRRSSPRRRKREQPQEQDGGHGHGEDGDEEGEGDDGSAMLTDLVELANGGGGKSKGNGGGGAFSFLWGTEKSGFMHLELYTFMPAAASKDSRPSPQEPQAQLVRTVSAGEWVVESVAGVDEARNLVFVTGTYETPLERHLYALPLHLPEAPSSAPPPPPTRLTQEAGMHTVVMDHAGRRVATVFSAPDTPAKTRLFEVVGDNYPTTATADPSSSSIMPHEGLTLKLLATLHDALDRRLAAVRAKVAAPEIFSLRPRDDPDTPLYAALYRPDPALHGPGPYPTVVSVYGGPHVQKVNRSWALTVDMMAQRLRDLGILVVKCDNRGSARRGLRFEAPLRHAFGTVEVRDQEDAVNLLMSQGLAARGHVGVYGWSYGGFLACMCLCKAPQTFRVGIAGAPVTSWDGYDTHYTERYLGLPQEQPAAYRMGSVLPYVHNLSGRLLLIHGQVDENVHFRHTARLINALIAARQPYDLLLFPDGRHSLRKAEDRLYLEQRITDFLSQTLLRENKALQQLQQPPSSTTGAGAGAPSPTNSNSSSSSKRPPSGPAAALPRVPSPPHPGINAHL